MNASNSDNKLFHKLIKKQRSVDAQSTKTLKRDEQTAENSEDILVMWRDHFQDLSNPDGRQDFDYEKLELSKTQNRIIEQIEKGKVKIDPIEDEEISLAVKNLKKGKSPDIDGISAEHYINAIEELMPVISLVLNTIIEHLDIPQLLKSGIMTPVLKKNKSKL